MHGKRSTPNGVLIPKERLGGFRFYLSSPVGGCACESARGLCGVLRVTRLGSGLTPWRDTLEVQRPTWRMGVRMRGTRPGISDLYTVDAEVSPILRPTSPAWHRPNARRRRCPQSIDLHPHRHVNTSATTSLWCPGSSADWPKSAPEVRPQQSHQHDIDDSSVPAPETASPSRS